MKRLRVAPIVEGHGEVTAVPVLLKRIWYELLGGEFIDVLRPIRGNRDQFVKLESDKLRNSMELAARSLFDVALEPMSGLILVMIDAEDDLACRLGPDLLKRSQGYRKDMDVSCVIVNRCYETWLVAAADSLRDHLNLSSDLVLPIHPEADDLRKSWITKRFRRGKYSERVHPVGLTAVMDLSLCRANSPSFDKLCRELEARLLRKPAG